MHELVDRLRVLDGHPSLGRLQRGIEKESLRVTPSGDLSLISHPQEIGSALTHPWITTDFAEAQLEFVSGVFDTPEACLDHLDEMHRFVYTKLDRELLWPASMPCIVGLDEKIPVGQYGTSSAGKIKTLYRLSLGHRYGRLMQTISGIHYNFSIPEDLWPTVADALGAVNNQDFRSAAYLTMARNLRRICWLLVYLFGASPSLCKSFLQGREHELEELDEGSWFEPYATSLRMGPLGYQSIEQKQLHISCNSLHDYITTLSRALSQNVEAFEKIGLRRGEEYLQLTTALLQTEAEYYGVVRPKRICNKDERLLEALAKRGIEYIELRCLDLDPFLPLGVDAETIRFLDTVLIWCLLTPSTNDSEADLLENSKNQSIVVHEGRKPGVLLSRSGTMISMHQWAHEVLDGVEVVAASMDQVLGNDKQHTESVAKQRRKVGYVEATPSARIIEAMRSSQKPFFRFAMSLGKEFRRQFMERALAEDRLALFQSTAERSIYEQKRLEDSDTLSFDDYLEKYLQLDIET